MKAQKFLPLLIIFAGLLTYYNSFHLPFIFDDVDSIIENPTIRHLWPLWDALSPPHGKSSTVEGRPVLNFSFAFNYALSGPSTWSYNALNVLIHILAALTLFGIVRRTLRRPLLVDRFGSRSTALAFVIAIVWMVHPLQTESVAYVAQRAESLMGLFYLLTLYCFIRGTESGKPGRWYVLSIAACVLGMGTKEVMVSAPLMVLLYDWLFVAGTFKQAARQRWRLYAGLVATWLVLGYLVTTTGNRGGTAALDSGIGRYEYAMTQCRAIVHYLRLSIWPYLLVFDYGTESVKHAKEVVPYALVPIAMASGTVVALWRRCAVGFLGAWFFAILAPSSSFVPVLSQTVAEHRMYLPLAAVIALVVLGADELGRRLLDNWPQTLKVFECGMSGAVVSVLALLTIVRNQDYKTDLTIWQDTVTKCPNNPRAHDSLALSLVGAGRIQEAIGQYEEALRIRPEYVEAHSQLGLALARTGNVQQAVEHYEEALRMQPDNAEIHNNLAIALFRLSKPQEAVVHFRRSLQLAPSIAQTHYNLAAALDRMGQTEEAIKQYEQALQLRPDLIEARNALVRLRASQ